MQKQNAFLFAFTSKFCFCRIFTQSAVIASRFHKNGVAIHKFKQTLPQNSSKTLNFAILICLVLPIYFPFVILMNLLYWARQSIHLQSLLCDKLNLLPQSKALKTPKNQKPKTLKVSKAQEPKKSKHPESQKSQSSKSFKALKSFKSFKSQEPKKPRTPKAPKNQA